MLRGAGLNARDRWNYQGKLSTTTAIYTLVSAKISRILRIRFGTYKNKNGILNYTKNETKVANTAAIGCIREGWFRV